MGIKLLGFVVYLLKLFIASPFPTGDLGTGGKRHQWSHQWRHEQTRLNASRYTWCPCSLVYFSSRSLSARHILSSTQVFPLSQSTGEGPRDLEGFSNSDSIGPRAGSKRVLLSFRTHLFYGDLADSDSKLYCLIMWIGHCAVMYHLYGVVFHVWWHAQG